MEIQIQLNISENGGVEVPKEITDILGSELKSTCIKEVWLLITNSNDNRFGGKLLQFDGTTYFLPKNQMSSLKMSLGDTIRLVFSDVLEIIFLQKLNKEGEYGETQE